MPIGTRRRDRGRRAGSLRWDGWSVFAAAVLLSANAKAEPVDLVEDASACTRAAAHERAKTEEEIPDIFFNAVNDCSDKWERVQADFAARNPEEPTGGLKYVSQVRDALRRTVVADIIRQRASRSPQ